MLANYTGFSAPPIKGKAGIKVGIIQTEIMISVIEKKIEIMIVGTRSEVIIDMFPLMIVLRIKNQARWIQKNSKPKMILLKF